MHLLDLARYKQGAAGDFAVAALASKPWRRIALSSSPENENYQRRAIVTSPARIGRLVSPLDFGSTGTIDWKNHIEVRMIYGGLSSVSKLAMLNGANRIAVQSSDGVWEISGFATAEEISPNVWRLSGLLRGLGGTEDATTAGALVDATVVVLDQSVKSLGLEPDEAELTLNWIAESYGQGGGRAGPVQFAGRLRAETPLAPVHLKAARTAGGDIALSWIRRSRIGSDTWGGEDIPLDEDNEAYRLQILDAGTVVRTVSVTSASFLYTSAMEAADFGTGLSEIAFRVRQKGSHVALGIATEKTISL
jgi:hypothetical protein